MICKAYRFACISKKAIWQKLKIKYILMPKLALIPGIAGACRKTELIFLCVGDISAEFPHFAIKIPNTKIKVTLEFVIPEVNREGQYFFDLNRKYISLRLRNVKYNTFSKCNGHWHKYDW